jgi:hypothetical protein
MCKERRTTGTVQRPEGSPQREDPTPAACSTCGDSGQAGWGAIETTIDRGLRRCGRCSVRRHARRGRAHALTASSTGCTGWQACACRAAHTRSTPVVGAQTSPRTIQKPLVCHPEQHVRNARGGTRHGVHQAGVDVDHLAVRLPLDDVALLRVKVAETHTHAQTSSAG